MGPVGNLFVSAARGVARGAIKNSIQDPLSKAIGNDIQSTNNAYSLLEMRYANELEQQNAREANRIAQENATIAFDRQKYLNDSAMAFNAEEAQKARDYDERMSNTAYQRAMEDMKAAGLNPILAYSQGGAAVTGGQAASIGSSTASQAQAYAAGTQRQYIDNRSSAEMKKTQLQLFGQLFSTFMNNATSVVNSFISTAGKFSGGE